MTFRRSLTDRVRRSLGGGAGSGRSREASDPQPGIGDLPPPIRPTRMIVSGSVFGELGRPVDQAHRIGSLDPRVRLWRDTAAVLVVFALAIAAFDFMPRPEQSVLAETDAPTQLVGEPQTHAPSLTPPDGSPSASPEPTPGPSDLPTLGPTPEPSVAGTPRPTPRPTPRVTTPPPTAVPSATPAPSDSPTPSDSPAPSDSPSPSPSESSSPQPSESPSPAPSDSPAPSETPIPPSESPGP